MNVMQLQDEFGADWHKYTLPVLTIQNSCSNCGDMIKRCVYWDPRIPFKARCHIEWPIECHLSDVKLPLPQVRGMPKFKDLITGSSDQL